MKKDEIIKRIGEHFRVASACYMDTEDDALKDRYLGQMLMCATILSDLLDCKLIEANQILWNNYAI